VILPFPGRFQNPDLAKWLIFPYVIIEKPFNGKVSERTLAKLLVQENLSSLAKGIETEFKEKSNMLESIFVGKPRYDKEKNIIWIKNLITKNSIGNMKLKGSAQNIDIIGLVLSNTGGVSVHCFSDQILDKDFINVCNDIIGSVEFSNNKYKHSLSWKEYIRELLIKNKR